MRVHQVQYEGEQGIFPSMSSARNEILKVTRNLAFSSSTVKIIWEIKLSAKRKPSELTLGQDFSQPRKSMQLQELAGEFQCRPVPSAHVHVFSLA